MEKKLTVLLLLIVENRILNNSTGDILSVYEQLKKRIAVYQSSQIRLLQLLFQNTNIAKNKQV